MNLTLRIATSVVGGTLFFGSYFFSYILFSIILFGLLLYILFFEWPPLMGGFLSLNFWLISPFYPILPMFSLIFLVIGFAELHTWLPLYPYLVSWVFDICAFFAGSFFGRHKMFPTISPGKTWEGFAAGFAGVLITNYFVLPYLQTYFPFSYLLWIFYTIIF